MKVPHKDQQDTFKESRKSIAGAHVPLKQIGTGGGPFGRIILNIFSALATTLVQSLPIMTTWLWLGSSIM